MVAKIVAGGAKPSYVRKVLQATAMLFDHAGIKPNPAREKTIVKLPRDRRPEVAPPTAEHVLAVPPIVAVALQAAAVGSRRDRDAAGRTGGVGVGRRRRAPGPLARHGGREQDEPRPMGSRSAAASRPSRRSLRVTTAFPTGRCFRGSAATGSAPRSHVPAPPPRSPRSRRTISVTVVSRCCIWAGCRGRGSVSTSGSATSPSPRTPTRTCSSTRPNSTTRSYWRRERKVDTHGRRDHLRRR